MKKTPLLLFSSITVLALSSCSFIIQRRTSRGEGNHPDYVDVSVNLYRKPNVVDKKMSLRFFETAPHVPYIGVKTYYKEFFNTNIDRMIEGSKYYYVNNFRDYICFDVDRNRFAASGLLSYNDHPDFKSSNGKTFVKGNGGEASDPSVRGVNLDTYNIHVYDVNGEAFVPLTLLSKFGAGFAGYNIAYNGQDVFVMDYNGELGDVTTASEYGSSYVLNIDNINKSRPSDLAEYNYGELCFTFDLLRGETEQMYFGDEDFRSLGLNGLLEAKHPSVKEYLLSTNKEDYFEGLYALFGGLWDGGHTGILWNTTNFSNAISRNSNADLAELCAVRNNELQSGTYLKSSFLTSRISALHPSTNEFGFYYVYNSDAKTAYIGFDDFEVDYSGAWDNYYDKGGAIPVNTDTFAYIRDKMIQAKNDGAENLVLDLTTNGGGNSYALNGIVGLLHGGDAYYYTKDTFSSYVMKEKYLIDTNLDGKYNNDDISFAKSFNFNVGILTSNYCFSCGNLLPYVLKDLGYKIIGEQSGGGSCAISFNYTADGIPFVHSSYLTLCDQHGNNIDGGVRVDYEISRTPLSATLYDCSSFYDMVTVGNYLSNVYK